MIKLQPEEQNPLLTNNGTPFGTPAFNDIKSHHFIPAFETAIRQHECALEQISSNTESPSFENTLVPLDRSDFLLKRISDVFFSLLESMSSPEMEIIAAQIMPVLTEHQSRVFQNQMLFQRVQSVFLRSKKSSLDEEEKRVLKLYYNAFIRAGAALKNEDRSRLNQINQRLSVLMLAFSNRVLKETDDYALIVDNPKDLIGLPDSVLEAASEEALRRGMSHQWVFTLHRSSFIPFLEFSSNRNLRQELYMAYVKRCDLGNDFDNKELVVELVNLRLEKANLLGYDTYADFVLEETMAKSSTQVLHFLNKLWLPSLNKAKSELAILSNLAIKNGQTEIIEPWDWWFYTEMERKEKYDVAQSELMCYFPLERVRDGAFMVAENLFGIRFVKNSRIEVYHQDVEVYEVTDADGSFLGLFYTDYYCRTGKRVGAWMGYFQESYFLEESFQAPFVYNVCNFVKAPDGKSSLLGLEEVETLFHEFGHALHGLLTKCRYRLVSGTNVPRDFVEFPSQLLENWGLHPEVLRKYARHVDSDNPIPDDLIEKIQRLKVHNQGFKLTEYIAAALLDMEWHQIKRNTAFDVTRFEADVLHHYGMPSQIYPRYRSVYFNHIFSNEYAAGYYSYLWAEVFDADVFDSFVQTSVFDAKCADLLRKKILEKGNAEDPMSSFCNFKGKELSFKAFLKRRGLSFF